MKIDWNKPLQTRDGSEVTIITRDGRGKYPVLYYIDNSHNICRATANGLYIENETHDADIINKPQKFTHWLNVYPNTIGCGHDSRAEADKAATSARIACIKVEGYAGRFDN